MIKLVVSDFDGTLLPYGETVLSKAVLDSIECLLSKGVVFAVASGRTYSELKALMGELSDRIYFICDDGALTVKNDEVVFKKPFSKEALKAFFDFYIYKNVILYSTDKAYYLEGNVPTALYGKTPKKITKPFEITEDVFKVTANAKCFDLADNNLFRIHYCDKAFVELVSPYANKGNAVSSLQLKLGLSKFDTCVIGDADNDVSMVKYSSRSWAIGKKSSKLVQASTDSSDRIEAVMQEIIASI